MSGVKLASPTFSAGPQDDLATADIYDGKEISVLNSIQKLSKQKEDELLKMTDLRGSSSAASKLTSWLKSATNIKLPDAAGMLSRLKAGASPYMSAFKSAQDGIKGAINTAMGPINTAKSAISSAQNAASQTINSVTSAARSVTGTVTGTINDVRNKIESAKSQVNSITGQVSTIKSSITGQINSVKQAFGEVGQSVEKLSNSATSLRSLNSFPSGVSKNHVYVRMGDTVSKIDPSRIQDVNDIASVLNAVKNEQVAGVDDKQATGAILAGIVKSAAYNHLYGTYDLVTKDITDTVILRNVAALSLPALLANGDITSIRQITEKLDSTVIALIDRDALGTLAAKYSEKKRLTVNERLLRYQDIISLFRLVNPTWDKVIRVTDAGEQEALNMGVFSKASRDFLETLRLGSLSATDSFEQLYSLSAILAVTDVETALKKSFPKTVLGRSARTNRSSVDPRSMANA